jgi:hypothetical protein
MRSDQTCPPDDFRALRSAGRVGLGLAAVLLLASACNKPTPEPGTGAQGYVNETQGNAANTTAAAAPPVAAPAGATTSAGGGGPPTSQMQAAGGPSGQTPAWGTAGGAPAQENSTKSSEPLGSRDPGH